MVVIVIVIVIVRGVMHGNQWHCAVGVPVLHKRDDRKGPRATWDGEHLWSLFSVLGFCLDGRVDICVMNRKPGAMVLGA